MPKAFLTDIPGLDDLTLLDIPDCQTSLLPDSIVGDDEGFVTKEALNCALN